jgi:biotin synthase-like enzyme
MEKTWFERAIFFSWYCGIRDCAYCYMSTQPEKKDAVRSKESLLAELIICKKLGWEIGFVSGGIGAFSKAKFRDLLESMHKVSGEKLWINVGALKKEELEEYLPYIKGVVGSIECANKEVHDKVCPSKPMEPYFGMFEEAESLGLARAMTIIVGLGETIDDFEKLKEIVEKYGITKIHFYGLNPQKGTAFENSNPPTVEYQAEWIKKTREAFPEMDIQCGIWEDRVHYIKDLLEAGATSISKYPALKKFGSESAFEIEKQAKLAGRKFEGTLTKLPGINWDAEVDNLDFGDELKEKIKAKLQQYVKQMQKNSHS